MAFGAVQMACKRLWCNKDQPQILRIGLDALGLEA
jgi:hypothetical protein